MSRRRSVLIVEDDPNDATLLQAAYEELQFPNPLRLVGDGKEAVAVLLGTGKYHDRSTHPVPGLMILDLKLPVMNGFQVLSWLQEHPELKAQLRVVVITSLLYPGTERRLRELGIDALLEKPLGFERLKEQMQSVKTRWLDRCSP